MCERVQAKQLFGELRTGLNFSLPLAKDKGTEKNKTKNWCFSTLHKAIKRTKPIFIVLFMTFSLAKKEKFEQYQFMFESVCDVP